MTTHTQYLRTKYFGALDGLRCLSILMVIGFHCNLTCTNFFRTGQYGVSLFFVISGFLITTLLLREQGMSGTISLKHFYIRRTLRIFPLYYAALLVYTALVVVMEHGPERGAFWRNWPYYFTYTSNWFVDKDAAPRVIFAFSWSLATEEQFYLLWPSIVRYARRWWIPLAIILSAAIVDMCFEAGTARAWLDFGNAGNRILTSVATPICLGCGLAYLLDHPRSFAVARPVLANMIAAPLALLGLLIAYLLLNEPLMIAFMVLLVGACCIRKDHLLAWAFSNPVVRYVGTISYGLYLLHMLAMNGTKLLRKEHDWLFFAIALAMSIAMASASYWMFEVPFLRLKNRFRRPEQPKADDHADPVSTATPNPISDVATTSTLPPGIDTTALAIDPIRA